MRERVRAVLLASGLANVGRSSPQKNPGGTELEVDNWALSRFVLAKLVPVVGVHPFPLHELMLMSAAICGLKPPLLFEWGTHTGKSARIFHECATHFGIPLDIHSVDLADDAEHIEHPHETRGKYVRHLPDVHLHQGDGLDTSLSIWRGRGRTASPFFFIDGDHSYESVRRETFAIAAEIPGASMLLHDAFYQSGESGYNVGPHQAIQDLRSAFPGRYRVLESGLGLPGMTLLYQYDR
jgi:cephalosporin hydroxylase